MRARLEGPADLFKVLGNDTQRRLLHAIHRGGEVRAGDLATAVGMTQQAVSNQLQRLVDPTRRSVPPATRATASTT